MGALWHKRAKEPAPSAYADGDPDSAVSKFLTGDVVRDQHSIEELFDELARISRRVAGVRSQEDLQELLIEVVDSSISRTRAERGMLVIERNGGALEALVSRRKGQRDLWGEPFSTSAVRKVLASGVPCRDSFRTESEARSLGASVLDLGLRALMCVPFTVAPSGKEDVLRGVLYVDSRKRKFNDADLSYFTVLCQQIAVVLDTARLHVDSLERVRLEQSLELASAIQRGFMSRNLDAPGGLDLHGWYEPAERASGDFYSFVDTRQGGVGIIIGDVAGHGIGPALVSASTQGSLGSLLKVVDDPAQAMTIANRDLSNRIEGGLFVSLCLAVLDGDGGGRVYSAGHPPPLVWSRKEDTVRQLEGHGPAFGIDPDFTYTEVESFKLDEGDTALFYTDGLAESRSASDPRELFGVRGLRAALANHAPRGEASKALAEAVARDVLDFSGGARADDMTLVALRRRAACARDGRL